jgi:hypothetical protein
MLSTPPLEVGIVRLVTVIAKHALGVHGRLHLREAPGLGAVFFMAAAAEVRHIRQLGDVRGWVANVFGQRAVASLAGHPRVLSAPVSLGFRFVAQSALGMPGVGDRTTTDHRQRAGAVVPVFPEVCRYHKGAQNQESSHAGQQNQRRANQVSRIPE